MTFLTTTVVTLSFFEFSESELFQRDSKSQEPLNIFSQFFEQAYVHIYLQQAKLSIIFSM